MHTEFELEQVNKRTTAVIDQEGALRSNAGAVALNNFVVAIDPMMMPATARSQNSTNWAKSTPGSRRPRCNTGMHSTKVRSKEQ